MRFICEFGKGAPALEIPVTLTAADLAELDGIRVRLKRGLAPPTDLDLVVMAMALRHAYSVAPRGYQHVNGGVHRAH